MKIRILALKDGRSRSQSSELSRSLHSATSALGGSNAGSDPTSEEQRDLSMLQAYNQLLGSKGCKTLDLEAELKQDPAWSASTKPTP